MTYRIFFRRGSEAYVATGPLESKDVRADCLHDALLCLPAHARIASVFEVRADGGLNRIA